MTVRAPQWSEHRIIQTHSRRATALGELSANFANANAQGSFAFATTMVGLHPDLDFDVLANDAVAAVDTFVTALRTGERS
jgi:hypothetical protein